MIGFIENLFSVCSREQINEMLCELYSPSVSMPEAPKQNFFAKLFASNAIVDPDLLCKIYFQQKNLSFHLFISLVGESAGKAPAGVIKREDINVNMEQLRGKANTTNSVVHDTRMVSVHCPHCIRLEGVFLISAINRTWSKIR